MSTGRLTLRAKSLGALLTFELFQRQFVDGEGFEPGEARLADDVAMHRG